MSTVAPISRTQRLYPTSKSVVIKSPGNNWSSLRAFVGQLNQISRHDVVNQGVRTEVLITLLDSYIHISKPQVYSVIGISSKTANRRKGELLPRGASDATLALIEITSMAENILGSHAEAEEWLLKPALGLDGRKPIDLIATSSGAELVRDHLTRMEYGVYA